MKKNKILIFTTITSFLSIFSITTLAIVNIGRNITIKEDEYLIDEDWKNIDAAPIPDLPWLLDNRVNIGDNRESRDWKNSKISQDATHNHQLKLFDVDDYYAVAWAPSRDQPLQLIDPYNDQDTAWKDALIKNGATKDTEIGAKTIRGRRSVLQSYSWNRPNGLKTLEDNVYSVSAYCSKMIPNNKPNFDISNYTYDDDVLAGDRYVTRSYNWSQEEMLANNSATHQVNVARGSNFACGSGVVNDGSWNVPSVGGTGFSFNDGSSYIYFSLNYSTDAGSNGSSEWFPFSPSWVDSDSIEVIEENGELKFKNLVYTTAKTNRDLDDVAGYQSPTTINPYARYDHWKNNISYYNSNDSFDEPRDWTYQSTIGRSEHRRGVLNYGWMEPTDEYVTMHDYDNNIIYQNAFSDNVEARNENVAGENRYMPSASGAVIDLYKIEEDSSYTLLKSEPLVDIRDSEDDLYTHARRATSSLYLGGDDFHATEFNLNILEYENAGISLSKDDTFDIQLRWNGYRGMMWSSSGDVYQTRSLNWTNAQNPNLYDSQYDGNYVPKEEETDFNKVAFNLQKGTRTNAFSNIEIKNENNATVWSATYDLYDDISSKEVSEQIVELTNVSPDHNLQGWTIQMFDKDGNIIETLEIVKPIVEP